MLHKQVLSLAAVTVLVLSVGVSVAAASGGGKSSYSPTLTVSLPLAASTLSASTDVSYTISGCGYNGSYGGVTVVVYTPVSVGWTGATPDANGCISVSNFSTQGAGTYKIEAWQQIGKKDVEVASTSFTLS